MELENVKTEDDLCKYSDYLFELESKGSISGNDNYKLFNKAFKQVYGHPAFDKNDNFIESIGG